MPKKDKDHRQDLAISKVEGRIEAVEDDIKEIKVSITNHIPTQIREITNKVDKLNDKILWGFIVMIASSLILQVILKFYN